MGRSRRTLLRSALLLAGRGAVGAAATPVPGLLGPDRLPTASWDAPANDHIDAVHHPSTVVTYYVQTTEPVVAFTFDDGPGPQWTSMVLDVLDAYQVPATFFVVGRNLQDHADLVRGRLDRHEVGNHSWSHADLARLDLAGVRQEMSRTHDVFRSEPAGPRRSGARPAGPARGGQPLVEPRRPGSAGSRRGTPGDEPYPRRDRAGGAPPRQPAAAAMGAPRGLDAPGGRLARVRPGALVAPDARADVPRQPHRPGTRHRRAGHPGCDRAGARRRLARAPGGAPPARRDVLRAAGPRLPLRHRL